MSVNQLIPVSAPQRKRRLLGTLYAATLLIAGGVIGAVVAGPTLGQGPQGPDRGVPRWQRGWSDNQDDDAFGRGPGQRGFGMHREGGGFGMRDRHDGPRMGWRDRDGDGPRMGWRDRDGDGPRMGGRDRDGDGPRMGGRGFGGMLFPGAIERRVNRVLGLVDASTEQRQKVRQILEAAGNDLYPIRQQRMENRKQIGQALAAATIDRAKIEALRQEQLKLNDTASKRMTDAITDAAEVLTPAQRAELAKRMEQRRRG
jgi:Spy/CpxP family protein refolding chaperone